MSIRLLPLLVMLAAAPASSFESEVMIVADPAVGLYEVDPSTGDRQIISSDTVGTGPSLTGQYSAVAVEPTGTLAVAVFRTNPYPFDDTNTKSVIRVDRATGDRTPLADESNWSSERFDLGYDLEAAPNGDLFLSTYIVQIGVGIIYRISPAGNVTAVAVAEESYSWLPTQILVEPNGDLLTGDRVSDSVTRVDTVTGAVTLEVDTSAGGEPLPFDPVGIARLGNGDFIAGGQLFGEFVRLDPLTLQRTLVAWEYLDLRQLVVDAAGDVLAVVMNPPRIVRIDPVTGSAELVSGLARGAGPVFGNPMGLARAPGTPAVPSSSPWAALAIVASLVALGARLMATSLRPAA